MLSSRGQTAAESLHIPWRFAPGGNNRYDKTSNPNGVISFGTAENNLMQEEIHTFVQKHVKIPKEAYLYRFSTSGGPKFPIAMASHINTHFHPSSPIQPSHIITGDGLTSIHEALANSFGDAGDAILVSRPIYGRFELDFGNRAGLETVYASSGGEDIFTTDNVSNYQDALDDAKEKGARVRALMIVNPHNPLGRCYTPQILRSLMTFCKKNKLHLISDEVYALSVYTPSTPFTSALAVHTPELLPEEQIHILYGMSKDFGTAGLRLGSLITRNTSLLQAISANTRFHCPSGPSIAIGTAILSDQEFVSQFIDLSRSKLLSARNYVTKILDEAGVNYHKESNAGFFLYIDLSPWLSPSTSNKNAPEFALAQKLLDAGVGLHPCEEHNEAKGWFRFVFSHEKVWLEVGLKRLISVLKAIEIERNA